MYEYLYHWREGEWYRKWHGQWHAIRRVEGMGEIDQIESWAVHLHWAHKYAMLSSGIPQRQVR